MKTLYTADEEFKAERIVKTDSEIIGYIDGKEVFKFEGLRNFSSFSVDGEWDISEPKEIDILRSEVEQLRIEVNELKGVTS